MFENVYYLTAPTSRHYRDGKYGCQFSIFIYHQDTQIVYKIYFGKTHKSQHGNNVFVLEKSMFTRRHSALFAALEGPCPCWAGLGLSLYTEWDLVSQQVVV